MARPLKQGVDYFPLDVRLDEKIELIESEYGLVGFAVVIKLWQRIYEDKGYWMQWSEEIGLLLSHRWGVPNTTIESVLRAAVRRGVFDAEIFERYNVLTSKGIQARYMTMVGRRREVRLDERFLLISPEDLVPIPPVNNENACKNRVFADNNPVFAYNNAQRKENKNKRNKSTSSVSAPSYDLALAEKAGFHLDPNDLRRTG